MSWEQIDGYIAEGGLTGSAEVESQLQRIAANPGKAGEAYLMGLMNSCDLSHVCLAKAVLLMGMSPFITFGVGSETVPSAENFPVTRNLRGPWTAGTIGLLKDLSERRLTGHNARDAIHGEFALLDDLSRALLYRVLVKEMRIGIGPTGVNKHHKKLIPVFAQKGAKKTKEAFHKMSWPCWAEYKYDGWRSIIRVGKDGFTSFSRNGLPMPNMDYRAADLLMLTRQLIKDGILEDRVWAWDGEGKADGHFNQTSSEARKAGKGSELVFIYFDLIPWEHMEGGTETIETRHARLARVEAWLRDNPDWVGAEMLRPAELFELEEPADAWELYEMAKALGHEGLILKRKRSFYIPGKNDDWVKVKPEETVDLLITGTLPGDKGSKYEGQIGAVTFVYQGKPGKAGSGLTDEDRRRDPSYFIGQVGEFLFHEVTPDGALREVRFAKLRTDKNPEDVDQ